MELSSTIIFAVEAVKGANAGVAVGLQIARVISKQQSTDSM